MFKKMIYFLFGRPPQIFDSKGEVCHKMDPQSWSSWKNRYKHDNEYNWKKHAGKTRQNIKTP